MPHVRLFGVCNIGSPSALLSAPPHAPLNLPVLTRCCKEFGRAVFITVPRSQLAPFTTRRPTWPHLHSLSVSLLLYFLPHANPRDPSRRGGRGITTLRLRMSFVSNRSAVIWALSWKPCMTCELCIVLLFILCAPCVKGSGSDAPILTLYWHFELQLSSWLRTLTPSALRVVFGFCLAIRE